jgi:hypothetical protein
MTLFRVPIRGWKQCVHESVAFESAGEYAAANLLDDAAVVLWWFRNDPPIFRIPSPAGNFEPDFVYRATRDGQEVFGALEVKSDIFWDGPGSDARVKAAAAGEWIRTINEARPEVPWELAVVLDQEALAVHSFEELLKGALVRFPEHPSLARGI